MKISLVVDIKYAGLLSMRLDRYKLKSSNPFVANFRCPVCGDSEKNAWIARGYFIQGQNGVMCYCHNCGYDKHLSDLLKKLDPTLYKEYSLETFKNEKGSDRFKKVENTVFRTETLFPNKSPLNDITPISELKEDHPARVYLEKRMISSKFFNELYYAETFNAWTNTLLPDKMPTEAEKEEGRIVIPFFTANGVMFGYQGRTLNETNKNIPRYITIMLDKEYSHKVYGLNRINVDEKVYVVEGPFDSLFLPNCIAMCGSDLYFDIIDKNNSVIVYDNENRNKDILKKIKSAIISGYKVCIWPDSFKFKDLNDAILGGMSKEEIKEIIDRCSYKGLTAQMELLKWRKIK